ncbi:MAG TPA: amidase [Methylomirabilota bacterium]|jgi:aspartyl-tRNA(Asn)/glutamyl-tRNA(Gln) amidotransferase subunit A
MDPNDLASLPAARAATLIADGTLSPVDLLESCLARIAAREAGMHAWAHVDEAGARAAARERLAEARAGRVRGPLHGVPVGIKDIFHVAGMTTTCGAAPAFHTFATEDATAVARLRAAGAIILGKTHTTEFAYFEPGPTRNPWNTAHTPGGSSSGSAAAVAARMAPLALGTQTVGSVLRPAAYCGVVGFKGTHGLIPTDGVVPLAWSFDHVGVFARAVADVVVTAGVLAGRPLVGPAPRPPRLALAPELVERATPETAAEVRATVARLARAGATVEEVKLPVSFAGVHAAGRTVLEVEASAYHEELYRVHAAAYRPRTRELIAGGLARPAVAYVRAQRARWAFREEVMPLLEAHDALLTPTAPGPAPEGLGATGDPWFCAPWSFAGVPACSLPTGVSALGLPNAVQLVAAQERDAALLAVAAWCERVLDFKLSP